MNAKPKRQNRWKRRLRLEQLDDRILMSVSPPQAVTVESYNLYAGAGFDLEKALADPAAFLASLSGSPDAQLAATTQAWEDIQATNFNERAEVIATQIVANRPDLIGLQEVWTYYTGIPDGNATQATKEDLNFLKVLQAKLAAKGLSYEIEAELTEHDFERPATINGVLQDLRANERLVILARADLKTAGVVFTNPQNGVFAANSSSQSKPIDNYGWSSIDVNWGGSKFRFVNMCLDIPIFPVTQAFQAAEIVTGPAATTLPVILVGDSNTGGNAWWPAYQILVGAGFKDAWVQTHPGEPGYTFGNRPDLKTDTVAMSYLPMRMDLVLERGAFQATSMKLLGVLDSERTVSGLWPSDHAGIVATLEVAVENHDQVELSGGVLSIMGTDEADRIELGSSGADLVVQASFLTQPMHFLQADVQRIEVQLLGGDDELLLGPGATLLTPILADGGPGNDTLFGAQGDDELRGGEDDDWLYGGVGNDSLFGGAGFDRMYGQWGDDRLFGGADRDVMSGQGGNDLVDGEDGPDLLYGNGGHDRLFGREGNDRLFGQDGNDVLVGGNGNDRLGGSLGRDVILAGQGTDSVMGHADDDLIAGGPTAYDDDLDALIALLAEWLQPAPLGDRTRKLTEGFGPNNQYKLVATDTLLADGEADDLAGNAGADWYLADPADLVATGGGDELTIFS